MNQSHRHASTAALAGQKRKLPPRPNSMLMISPASDTNLMTVYQHQRSPSASAAATANLDGTVRGTRAVSAAAAAVASAPGYTPIQPAPPRPGPNQPWPTTTAPVEVVGLAAPPPTAAAIAPPPGVTAIATQLMAPSRAPTTTTPVQIASALPPPSHHQHATVLSTPMVQMVAAQNGAAAVTMPATLALAQAHAAAAASAGIPVPAITTGAVPLPAAKTKSTAGRSTKSKSAAAQATPVPVPPPPTPPVPSPVEFVKKRFRDWGVQIQPTRDASNFLKATPDRIAAYNRDLLATVRQSDMTKLGRLHSEGKVKNACNPFGESLLHLACRKGLTEVVVFLCAKPDGPRLSLYVHDDYGRTVLHDACWTVRPQWPLVEFLIEHAPQLLACSDVRGHIPLDYIPKSDWKVWMDFLVERETKLKSWMSTLSGAKSPPPPSTSSSSSSSSPTTSQATPRVPPQTSTSGIPVPQQVLDQQPQQQQEKQQHDQLKATLQAAVMEKSTSLSSSSASSSQQEDPPGLVDTSQSGSTPSSSSSNSLVDAVTAATTATVAVETPKPTSSSEGQAPRIMG